MKKLILITMTFVFGGLSTSAATVNPSDKFQQLVTLAYQGKPVSFDEAEGVYTGRCYELTSRNHPYNSVLLITQIETGNGPLFPKEKVVIEGGYNSGPADVADSKTKETLIDDFLEFKPIYVNMIESPLSVTSVDPAGDTHKLAFFKNQNYILALVTTNHDLDTYVRGGTARVKAKRGDIWVACYYFNKK